MWFFLDGCNEHRHSDLMAFKLFFKHNRNVVNVNAFLGKSIFLVQMMAMMLPVALVFIVFSSKQIYDIFYHEMLKLHLSVIWPYQAQMFIVKMFPIAFVKDCNPSCEQGSSY